MREGRHSTAEQKSWLVLCPDLGNVKGNDLLHTVLGEKSQKPVW